MKRFKCYAFGILSIIIASLLCFTLLGCNELFHRDTPIQEYTGIEITKLTFRTIDYNGGATDEYLFDFRENTASKRWYIPYNDKGIPDFKEFASFTDADVTVFMNKCYTYGLFSLEKKYETTEHIIDGGGWNLYIEYIDGTSISSMGSNASPYEVFGKCKYAFYELCKDGVVGYLPNSFFYPPNIDISFSYPYGGSFASSNGLARVQGGNYLWNGHRVSDVSYFEINQNLVQYNEFIEGIDYDFSLSTYNYGRYEDYDKFTKCTVTCYDYNEAMTNKKEILSAKWFKSKSFPLEFNKIYIYKLMWKNGDYVEYTFNTCLPNSTGDPVAETK